MKKILYTLIIYLCIRFSYNQFFYAAGLNKNGEFGNGTITPPAVVTLPSPTLQNYSGISITKISCNDIGFCYFLTQNSVYFWGNNQ